MRNAQWIIKYLLNPHIVNGLKKKQMGFFYEVTTHMDHNGSLLLPQRTRPQAKMVMMGLGRLVGTLKSKIRSLKLKKPYDKMEKSESMRVEIRSRKARKLIEETLKIADSPKSRTFALSGFRWTIL
ncbi:unnamed protein product [Sphenostylis stenocarpa]|uniref:Uncharacterized protein n=1 Tax=Sphenostylis stenocarpa TaxID=92480 RepID=A0AA86S1B7_9FABA|nr:unnamed protein product [Sphenostylis stenocarpa]